MSLDRHLTKAAGWKVKTYNLLPAYQQMLVDNGYPPYAGPGFYQTRTGKRPLIHLGPDLTTSLQRTLEKRWPDSQQELSRLAYAVFALGRERGHAVFRDVMHGRDGHDDARANKIAVRKYVYLARRLGIPFPVIKAMQKQLVADIGDPLEYRT